MAACCRGDQRLKQLEDGSGKLSKLVVDPQPLFFLVTDGTDYTTGQSLRVDGGLMRSA